MWSSVGVIETTDIFDLHGGGFLQGDTILKIREVQFLEPAVVGYHVDAVPTLFGGPDIEAAEVHPIEQESFPCSRLHMKQKGHEIGD